MKLKKLLWALAAFPLFTATLSAQTDSTAKSQSATPVTSLELIFPERAGWNVVNEGQKLEFDIKARGGSGNTYSFSILNGLVEGMNFDSAGHFSWTPNHDFVDRLKVSRAFQMNFEVKNNKNEHVSKSVEFRVNHVNRPPVVGELKPLYVQYNVLNTYQIDPTTVKDEDGDPLVFIPITDEMPEGAKLSGQGEFTWKPSLSQFNQLKNKPLYLEFYVEDQPSKARVKGKFKIDATSMDLEPQILMVPSSKVIRYKEDATINLIFNISDPNGDSDIAQFNFTTENPGVPKSALRQNSASQYEFTWTPDYNFVKDPLDSVSFDVTFFVTDKTRKRDEEKVKFVILNAINEKQKDQRLYNDYRTSLVRAWDLLEQLKEKEEELKKDYRRARKGKKGRSVANASLGAITGISPIVLQKDPTSQKAVSAVGGTTVMTVGTLEATEVIGKSTKDVMERLNYVMEKKHEIQTRGDIFARKYSLRSTRRNPEFTKDLDDFVALMNLRGLVALELNAGWENKTKASDAQLAKTFKDFSPYE
jgi:hypothetical protein